MQENEKVDFNQKLEEVLATEDYYQLLAELLGNYRVEYKEVNQKLASAHNSGKLDILKFLNSPHFLDGNISHIRQYLGVIGLIEAPTKAVFETSQRILSKGEYCNIPISEFLGENKSRITDAVEMLADSPTKWEFFLRSILISQSKISLEESFQFTIELTAHSNQKIQTEAILALGYLKYSSDNDLLEKALDHIHSLLEKKHSSELTKSCLQTINEICKKNFSFAKGATKSIILCLLDESTLLLEEVSQIIWLDKEHLPAEWEEHFLRFFDKFSITDWQKVHVVDYALAALLNRERSAEVIALLEQKLVVNNNVNLEITNFHDISKAIWESEYIDHEQLFTRWFYSGNHCLCQAASDIISEHENSPSKVSKIEETQDYLYIARKAVGWLFIKPKLATFYVLSVLENCDESDIDKISNLLFYPLIMNTPHTVEEVIKEHVAKLDKRKKKAQALVKVLKKSNAYHDVINKASLNKELHPSTRSREAMGRKRLVEHEAMMKEVHKTSFLASLFGNNKKVILYGNKSVYKQYGGNGESKRQVMPLSKISHSTEVPILFSIDPVGLNRLINIFRYER
ncbi:hypothetical protein [Vibrio cincinnatiensis]|uniref:hypothetical protein n=1 Tax=Vibrio cincinnatiensis TaxID=675 RepID=UPI001EDEDF33|nr:hypothetical protein [Vibrio cincinnatiensis]MCG3721475.1 hypothetical protein [Vibrio cincinnatiensis]